MLSLFDYIIELLMEIYINLLLREHEIQMGNEEEGKSLLACLGIFWVERKSFKVGFRVKINFLRLEFFWEIFKIKISFQVFWIFLENFIDSLKKI